MAKDKNVRFIRKNGKLIPIKAKDPSKKKMDKNYKKYGDGADQASRIDEKFAKKRRAKTKKFGFAGAAGILGGAAALQFRKGKVIGAGLVAGGLASSIAGKLKDRRLKRRQQTSIENEYVKAFGMGSEGERPFRRKKRRK